jgi:hypothetical protein
MKSFAVTVSRIFVNLGWLFCFCFVVTGKELKKNEKQDEK